MLKGEKKERRQMAKVYFQRGGEQSSGESSLRFQVGGTSQNCRGSGQGGGDLEVKKGVKQDHHGGCQSDPRRLKAPFGVWQRGTRGWKPREKPKRRRSTHQSQKTGERSNLEKQKNSAEILGALNVSDKKNKGMLWDRKKRGRGREMAPSHGERGQKEWVTPKEPQ